MSLPKFFLNHSSGCGKPRQKRPLSSQGICDEEDDVHCSHLAACPGSGERYSGTRPGRIDKRPCAVGTASTSETDALRGVAAHRAAGVVGRAGVLLERGARRLRGLVNNISAVGISTVDQAAAIISHGVVSDLEQRLAHCWDNCPLRRLVRLPRRSAAAHCTNHRRPRHAPG